MLLVYYSYEIASWPKTQPVCLWVKGFWKFKASSAGIHDLTFTLTNPPNLLQLLVILLKATEYAFSRQ